VGVGGDERWKRMKLYNVILEEKLLGNEDI
jgi:hypothetical protein